VASPTPQQLKRKCDILEELAGLAKAGKDRAEWLKQLADVLSAAVQVGSYPDGSNRLQTLHEKLADDDDKDLKAYVKFRLLTALYNLELSKPDVDYPRVQAKWLADLEEFVNENPASPDSAEAMLQLAMGEEFSGDDKNAVKWYERVIKGFPNTAAANKSAGAVRRLESVGKPIAIKGKSLGGKVVDLAAAPFKGKVVLIHYWSSDINACKIDLPAIEKMVGKYEDFAVIGIALDDNRAQLENYLRGNTLPWANLWEEGGMNNRLANEMGILTLPTMILVDRGGKVVNRNIHGIDLDEELKKMLKVRTAKR
jgi:thiol-disulfide isomerase/thioredoxin